jgi:Xaa-Pro aminopeptidase
MTDKPFSEKEVERRQQAIRDSLAATEAFVAFSFTASYYFSGAPVVHWGRPTITVVPQSAPVFAITSAMEAPRLESLGHIHDVQVYTDSDGPSLPTALSLFSRALRNRGIDSISFDASMTPCANLALLKKLCPTLATRDGSADLNALRKVHSEEEIAQIRKAVAASDVGVNIILEEAKIGQPESDVVAMATRAMAEFSGANYPETEMSLRCYSQQGDRTLQPHSGTGGDPLTQGNLLQIVIEASAWQYLSAVERTVALGNLPAEQDAYFDTLIEAHEAALTAAQPGAPLSAPYHAANSIFTRDGFGESPVGTGLLRGVVSEWEGRIEEGNLRGYNNTPLQSGMVMSIEPYTFVPGVGATRHCDMVLITETGNECISKAPRGRLRIG